MDGISLETIDKMAGSFKVISREKMCHGKRNVIVNLPGGNVSFSGLVVIL